MTVAVGVAVTVGVVVELGSRLSRNNDGVAVGVVHIRPGEVGLVPPPPYPSHPPACSVCILDNVSRSSEVEVGGSAYKYTVVGVGRPVSPILNSSAGGTGDASAGAPKSIIGAASVGTSLGAAFDWACSWITKVSCGATGAGARATGPLVDNNLSPNITKTNSIVARAETIPIVGANRKLRRTGMGVSLDLEFTLEVI